MLIRTIKLEKKTIPLSSGYFVFSRHPRRESLQLRGNKSSTKILKYLKRISIDFIISRNEYQTNLQLKAGAWVTKLKLESVMCYLLERIVKALFQKINPQFGVLRMIDSCILDRRPITSPIINLFLLSIHFQESPA